ncbi:cytochrome oxidase complex assembly protein 1-domain-containing protein [Rhodocollybia butyracea]|uniref:Cytochrome oxidase complex assembly protein 1-domain-containing protein n=1 Tax=Rhodocollybia butyracea TaxID=206335 RepID=A0A9P5PZB1_9AGAR|nr:cytochrome oxidase complex assembly protein 1-domain-containing protein [Rhodocollybia butyracea]
MTTYSTVSKLLMTRRSPFTTTVLSRQKLQNHFTQSSRKCLSTTSRQNPMTESPSVTMYSGTSRPRPYHLKHPPPQTKRDLPRIKSNWPTILAFSVVGVAGWAVFLAYVTNQEKISSSVVKQIMRELRVDEELRVVLGDAIRMQGEWWLNGDPRIIGSISTMQGNIDISFRIKGSRGTGTVYFTSIRREKGVPFEILRFKVIADDGTIIYKNLKT